jgi:putative oxidoreductase
MAKQNPLITTTLTSPMADYGVLILRVGMAALMIPHGYDKLQSALAGSTDFPDPIGVGKVASMYLTIFAEFFCSILLLFGKWTRLALVPLIICMAVVYFIVAAKEPFSDKQHPLMYLISYVSLYLTGPGKYSLDGGGRK